MFDQPEEAKIRYLAVTEAEDRHPVLVEQPGGRVFALAVVFPRRSDADDYCDVVNRMLGHIVRPGRANSLLAILTQRITEDVLTVFSGASSAKSGRTWSDGEIQMAKDLRAQGKSIQQIASHVGRSLEAVTTILKKQRRAARTQRVVSSVSRPPEYQEILPPAIDPLDEIRRSLVRQIASKPAPSAEPVAEVVDDPAKRLRDAQEQRRVSDAGRRLKLQQLWESGMDPAEIATELGYANKGSVMTIARHHMHLASQPAAKQPETASVKRKQVTQVPRVTLSQLSAPKTYQKPLAKDAVAITADELVAWFKGREFRCEKRGPDCFLLGPTRFNREDLDRKSVV